MDLHVVVFSVPYPPDYGGAIDVWHRLRALAAEGVRLTVHAFVYDRFRPSPELESLATATYYYPRTGWSTVVTQGFPLSVHSRRTRSLLARLTADRQPILFEGTQTTGWAASLPGRRRLLRAHNIEHAYYAELALQAAGPRKWLFGREAKALAAFEETMWRDMDMIFPISPADANKLSSRGLPVEYMPPFHGLTQMDVRPGRGSYLLYHGDLSIGVNQHALLDLLGRLLPGDRWPVVVAGRSGSEDFERKIRRMPNITRRADVSQGDMDALIREAQVVIIHSLHTAGMKLKLFPALFQARFIAVSDRDVTGTPLDDAFHVYASGSLQPLLADLWNRTFDEAEAARRRTILGTQPDDRAKARQILRYL